MVSQYVANKTIPQLAGSSIVGYTYPNISHYIPMILGFLPLFFRDLSSTVHYWLVGLLDPMIYWYHILGYRIDTIKINYIIYSILYSKYTCITTVWSLCMYIYVCVLPPVIMLRVTPCIHDPYVQIKINMFGLLNLHFDWSNLHHSLQLAKIPL